MKNTKLIIGIAILMLVLAGCTETKSNGAIQDQQQQKIDQAEKVMQQTKVPTFNESLERENIRNRLIISNDPNTLQWIYPMSAGRVIGRFPVKGKVTSGGKRLTSAQMTVRQEGDSGYHETFAEAPDEMGTYGNSGDYIFWFDPAGRIHQFKGDYFISTVPYKIDAGFGTISMETDATEENKRNTYEQQIKESNSKPVTSTTTQGGK